MGARPVVLERTNEKGLPEGRPSLLIVTIARHAVSGLPVPLVRYVERGVQDRDVFPCDLPWPPVWLVGPPDHEVVLVDGGDDADPPADGFAVVSPIFPEHVGADV